MYNITIATCYCACVYSIPDLQKAIDKYKDPSKDVYSIAIATYMHVAIRPFRGNSTQISFFVHKKEMKLHE